MIRVLGRKEEKQVLQKVAKLCGEDVTLFGELLSCDGQIFLGAKDVAKFVDHFGKQFRIERAGILFCTLGKEMRFSIEGAQIIAPCFKKKVALNLGEGDQWMLGDDLQNRCGEEGFILLHSGEDILGVGVAKGDKILNTVPKERRIKNRQGYSLPLKNYE